MSRAGASSRQRATPDEDETDPEGLRARVERLHHLVLERLIEALEHGVAPPPSRAGAKGAAAAVLPPPPAYLSAAIRFLKDNGALLTAEGRADELEALVRDLSEADPDYAAGALDDEDDDDWDDGEDRPDA